MMKLLFLGKKEDPYCQAALDYCTKHFDEVSFYLGDYGDAWPAACDHWEGDLVISYLSRWIIPQTVLEKAKTAAINFHPAPPEYPGTGCINFALYEGASEYGATCHFMLSRVDTGGIIRVVRFPLLEEDTVESLLQKTYKHQLTLFYEVMEELRQNGELKAGSETWSRKPLTRKNLNTLMTLSAEMDETEIKKRIRATSYKQYQPAILLHGHRFELKP